MVERVKVFTPPFRVSFPSVFEPSSYEGSAAKYSVVGLWYPSKFTAKHKALWAKLVDILDAASLEKFKRKVKDLPDSFKKGIRDGADKAHLEGYNVPGMKFATMSSRQKPGLVDKDGTPILSAEDFYPGCWARATVTAYAYDNKGKGIALGLHNLQKLGDDANFTGRVNAEDDFGDNADEVWDDSMSGTGGSSEPLDKDDPLG